MVEWEWDSKFRTIQTRIGKQEEEKMFALLKETFQSNWNYKIIKKAPESITKIVDTLGGLKEGQYLFFSDPELDIMIYAAWWPWAAREWFSIRLGLIVENISDEEYIELRRLFQTWFEQ